MDSKRAWRAGCLSIIILAVGFACGRDDSERSGSRSDAVTNAMPDTTFACALVQDLRSRFTISSPLPIAHAADGGLPVGLPNQAMLPLGIADAFVSAPETIQPHWPAQEGANAKSTVALPARSGSPFALTELGSSTSIRVGLVGARDVAVQTCAGFAVYPGAGPNGEDVLHRPTPQGTEDYVSLNLAPPTGEMVYQITLDPHVAGLRLVANTLEFVEASGSPRLRIAAPYLVDSSRKRIDAQIALEGCAADTNPAGPWGRAITPPGASTCRVHVAWDSATVAYPALLDPSWTATGSMVTGRYYQATSLLQSGKVLVAGGIAPNGVQVATAEIYDPGSGAWATTGSLRYPTFGALLNVNYKYPLTTTRIPHRSTSPS